MNPPLRLPVDDKDWPKRWQEIVSGGDTGVLELYNRLERKYLCARCGRNDLPLALFFEHEKSCAYECPFFGSTCELYDQWISNEKPELEDRIERLETACRDGLNTIHWFEGWLNGRDTPLTYDDSPCRNCKHGKGDHRADGSCGDYNDGLEEMCPCPHYIPTKYSVSYTTRDVARMKNSIAKAMGPEALDYLRQRYGFLERQVEVTDFHCDKCRGLFDLKHLLKGSNSTCEWCR